MDRTPRQETRGVRYETLLAVITFILILKVKQIDPPLLLLL